MIFIIRIFYESIGVFMKIVQQLFIVTMLISLQNHAAQEACTPVKDEAYWTKIEDQKEHPDRTYWQKRREPLYALFQAQLPRLGARSSAHETISDANARQQIAQNLLQKNQILVSSQLPHAIQVRISDISDFDHPQLIATLNFQGINNWARASTEDLIHDNPTMLNLPQRTMRMTLYDPFSSQRLGYLNITRHMVSNLSKVELFKHDAQLHYPNKLDRVEYRK